MRDVVRRVGQRFMVGFEGYAASADVKALIREFGVGHVVLFARNVAGPEQVAELVRELQAMARDAGHERPLLVAVDQEGGRVARLKEPWTVWPAARARGPHRAARRPRGGWARPSPSELKACGIRYDFAPCVDVDTNPKNPVIGDRSFGDDPELVGRLGAAMIRGLQDERGRGVRQALPGPRRHRRRLAPRPAGRSTTRARRLEDVELRPFRKAIEAGRRDGDGLARPRARARRRAAGARSRRRSSTGLLRKELGFAGVVVDRRPRDEGPREALDAGADRGAGGEGRLRPAGALPRPRRAGRGDRGPDPRARGGGDPVQGGRGGREARPRAQGALPGRLPRPGPEAGPAGGRAAASTARSPRQIAVRSGIPA